MKDPLDINKLATADGLCSPDNNWYNYVNVLVTDYIIVVYLEFSTLRDLEMWVMRYAITIYEMNYACIMIYWCVYA
jgi:hypothetical protein